jgi:hypothetical protein
LGDEVVRSKRLEGDAGGRFGNTEEREHPPLEARNQGKQKVRLIWKKWDTMGSGTNRGKSEAVAARQEVPKEEAQVEAIGAPEDRPMGQEPTVGYSNPRKRWAKDAVVRGASKRQTFEKKGRKQPKFNNGIRTYA